MSRAPSSVAHRKGGRVRFIPTTQGAVAKWAAVMDAVDDQPRRDQIARSATATIRRWTAETGAVAVEELDASMLSALTPDELIEVRRPASHTGMTNYIGRMPVPSAAHDVRGVWFESFNEQAHLRDLLLTQSVSQLSTQPMELTWIVSPGIRRHIPDFLTRMTHGSTLLVDVTTQAKFEDPRVRAVCKLTAATAESLGWKYQVRTELPPQRQRNVSFIWACRTARPDHVHRWRQRLDIERLPQQVHTLARALDHDGGGLGAVWHLIATQHLAINLDKPMRPDTVVDRTRGQAETRRPSWVVAL